MAQSGYTEIQVFHSTTPGVAPTTAQLISGELFLNAADGKIYYLNTSGTVSSFVGGGGLSGFSGYSGFSGFTGASGFSGSGVSGYSGASGFSGFSGATAASGYSGISGYSGTNGASGYSGSGVSGYSGYSGLGLSGYSGYSGYSSFSGFSGISGFSGYSGAAGGTGSVGTSGFSGYSGLSGYSGFNGATGPIGNSGFSGYSGTSGFSGINGASGFSGASGISGYSGSGISGFSGFSGYSGATSYTATNLSGGYVSATNISYTGTLTGTTGTVNIGSGRFYIAASSGNVSLGYAGDANVSLYVRGGNSNNFAVDNAGQQYTTVSLYNAGSEKAQWYWDQTNSLMVFGTDVNSAVTFKTATVERMRISATGGVSVGTATDPGAGNFLVNGSIKGNSYSTADFTISESGGKLYFAYQGTNVASLDSSGNFITLGGVTASGTP